MLLERPVRPVTNQIQGIGHTTATHSETKTAETGWGGHRNGTHRIQVRALRGSNMETTGRIRPGKKITEVTRNIGAIINTMIYSRFMSRFNTTTNQTIVRVEEIRSAQTQVTKNLPYTEELHCVWCLTGPWKASEILSYQFPMSLNRPLHLLLLLMFPMMKGFTTSKVSVSRKHSTGSWVYLINSTWMFKPV